MLKHVVRVGWLLSVLGCGTAIDVAHTEDPQEPAPPDDVTPPPDDVTPPPDDVTPPPDDVTPPLEFTPGDHAVIVAQTLPASLDCNQRTTVTVTVRNMGDTTWTAATDYRLGAVDDADPFLSSGNRVYLGENDVVAPGGEHTFTIELAATVAGTFTSDWRMVHDGVQWFGDVASRSVDVACNANSTFYPCVIDGQFNMPAHEQRIAARNASLIRTGHAVTGNDDVDNAVLGGGSPDGGIWLSGQFHFEVNAGGQIIANASWLTVFRAHPINGGPSFCGE
jgi:hypothetical protein